MPFDVRKILEQLGTGSADVGVPAWLQESWGDPEGFAVALATASVGRGPPLKSRPGQHHDFFHDLIARHANTDLIALRTWSKAHGWRTLGYRQLHEQAARRATTWAQQGVKPGARVCLLYHPGPELLVSLAAALGLGACISILPPQGRGFLTRRLTALAPEHIAAEPHQALLLGDFEKLLLHGRGNASPAFTSHTYKPAEPVGLLFSPLAEPPDVPVPLTADDAWHGALVDGLLTFGLGPGEHLAAPGFHPLQHLPALLFATLLRGATFLHLEPADLETNPAPLTEHPLRALGVTPALRDVLLKTRTRLEKVGHWFRNPEEPLDWQSWREWVKQCGLSSVPTSNVLVDAAAGGAVLCSPRRVGDIHLDAAPAPGRRWALKDLNLSGQEAPGDVGLFTLLPDKDRPLPYVILSRVHGQYLYGGTRNARREGRVYPAAEVMETLESLASLRGTSVFAVPVGGTSGQHRHLLLAFTGARQPDGGTLQQEIRRCIELQLGAEHLPDRYEFFPLYPRRKKGRIDEAWCHWQYQTGALHKKSTDALAQALTALRGHVLDTEGKPGDDDPAGQP
ncbi:AMP-binding protein [Archangium violaceum]|uniref:AMP-binding protein n=1 Tax=Archangium violaceum TaxID=83451 RepID=UPI00193BA254|nr:AMP-binding protein [Archangium violaceum]QRK06968.1 AMP-binding protein [Archangium violaceum]